MFKKFSVQLGFLIGTTSLLILMLVYFYLLHIKNIQIEVQNTTDHAVLVSHIDQLSSAIINYSFAFLIITIIFLFGAVINIISVFITSLNRLLSGISKFDHGDRRYRINLISQSELGTISSYLDKTFNDIEEYERQIGELSSLVSHQLKSPLTVITGSTELMLDKNTGPLNNQQQELLQTMYDTEHNMQDLIKNVLDVSRLDKNEAVFKNEKIDLLVLLQKSIDSMKEYIDKSGAEIGLNSAGTAFNADIDSLYVGQVFQNLIDNAIRYSRPPAKVDISVERKGDKIVMSFADQGIGIPDDEKQKIMSRFYRATNAIKFKAGGTGLGLYIIKSVMNKMGGDFWFDSRENLGSTFYLEFPKAAD